MYFQTDIARKVPAALKAALVLVPVFFFLSPLSSHAEQTGISGFTEAVQDSTLGVSTTGRVSKIHVKSGERVEQGQVLLELEQYLEYFEVDRRKLLWEDKSDLNAAERRVKTLSSHLETSRKLHRTTGSIALEDLENQELEEATAKLEFERLKMAEKREYLEYKIARQQLEQRTIRAPFAGHVADLLVELGENCDLDTLLLRLVDTRQGYFVANVELGLSQRLRIGQKVGLQFPNGVKPITREAEITFISPVVDPASGLRKIKALFDNKDQKITLGASGTMLVKYTALPVEPMK